MKLVCLFVYDKNKNKSLLIKREKDPYKGYWGMTGGKIKEGESSEIAATRELEEETGIKLAAVKCGGKCREEISESGKVVYSFDIDFYCFECDLVEVQSGEEGELVWFNVDEIKNLKVIPSDIPMIENFLEHGNFDAESKVEMQEEKYFQKEFILK